MPYGKPKLTIQVGDRVQVDLRNNGKLLDGELTSDKPRISALCAGSIEWLIRVEGKQERWVSESLIYPCAK